MKDKLIEMLKQAYMNYKDDGDMHDYCVMCNVGKNVFNMTDEEIESLEDKWTKEYYESEVE